MADPTWLGLGGLVASTLSALAAYLAIRQNIIQRRISNKVQITVKGVEINLARRKIINSIDLTSNSDEFTMKPFIINIGLGPALNFVYSWDFDYLKHLEINEVIGIGNENDIHSKQYLKHINSNKYSFEYSNETNAEFIHILGNGKTAWFHHPKKNNEIDYILPWSVSKSEVHLKLPNLIPMLLAHYLAEYSKSSIGMFLPITGPTLILCYEDITGVKIKEVFTSSFVCTRTSIKGDTYEAGFSLTFSPRLSRTAQVIQRIRKSYVEFIKENDFNKNK
ncbi:hypothetical protein ACTPL4_004690 [Klebsiella pneumoniae]|nr:hypothetical protein [Klebsiella pneumoniae]HDS9531612.1 hypothetical protein [Klebsiella pneumoniae subsp. pneumoniae]MCE0208244.1 hypothetical protein [Klebsiella pneumoniae]MCP6174607.1 hypothetical protein [Klebsiella pneumoniae]MDP1141238.1 hypothetical protein [Klebsiella pneumoniae]MDZ0674416.1 hypothetical protein [Klebsiella pneumoniae]